MSNAFECPKGKAAVLVAVTTIGAVLSSAGRLTALIESVAVGDVESILAGDGLETTCVELLAAIPEWVGKDDRGEIKVTQAVNTRHFVNVHAQPDYVTKRDANSELQRDQPEWYGPYLEEGERYQTPRTAENVAKACDAMGLNTLAEEHKGEREYYAKLVYDLWVLFDDKLRAVKGVKIDLDLGDLKPIRFAPYRLSPTKVAAMRKLVEEFIEEGIVSEVTSEWGFPALLVPKPKGGYRLVVDLRELNKHLPHDTYEPPTCDLCLEWLAGRPFRTTQDCRWGFHQVELTERARRVITFVTPFGTFCYNRLVMGYRNATAEFQRAVNNTLGPLLWRTALSMVDDVITASATLAEHRQDVLAVWTRLACRGHSLKPEKVRILQEEVEYLGHISTPTGLKPTPKHVRAIADMPKPVNKTGKVNITRLRSFLGMVKYCRRYIENCGKICDTLNGLLCDSSDGVWTDAHQEAMDKLKRAICDSKGVYHINYHHPIYVCSDGSKRGIGGYLFQVIDGDERVIAYFSRSTRPDEKKWDTRELEILAMLCTLEYFHQYIDGQRVNVQTDHRNILWLSQLKNPSGRLSRWVMRLQEYDAVLSYKAGKTLHIADCLSRNSVVESDLGRRSHTEPAGIWMEDIKREGRFALRGEELFAGELQGYVVTPASRLFKFEVAEISAAAEHTTVQVGASQLEDELVSTSEVAATAFGREPESLEAEHGTHNETDAEEELFYKREILGEVMWNAFMGECDAPIPESLQTAHLGWKQIEQAQAGDKWVKGCVEQLKREKVSEYELIRGVLHRVKKNEDGTCAAARIYLPESLRVIAIRNAHDSIWGGHRSDTATFKDMVMKYYWPKRIVISRGMSRCVNTAS